MIESDLIYSDLPIYESKLPALPPNPSPSQSSIITITTSVSSHGTESNFTEDDDLTSFILAQIEKQNVLLEKDPKAICIQSNKLKAHFSTMQQLVKDNTTDDEEERFWESMIQNADQITERMPHLLLLKLRSGIPSHVRGLMWQIMSKSASLHLETVYEQLCKEKSPHERIIKRDLSRTFPHIDMFKQENGHGQSAMKRILEAYSLYDTDVGYCQGLAFLVGPLLLNMPETESFCVFVRLMETYEMRSMFTLNMEGLQLRLFQFSQLLKEILPNLAHHLDGHGIHAAMYASQWFLTLFAYVFPMELIHRIYDIVFAEGATETIMRVAIAMLKRSEAEILTTTTEFEDTLDFLTSRRLCETENFNNVIHDAMSLSDTITKARLEKLTSKYNSVNAPSAGVVKFGFWRRRRGTTTNIMRRSASIGSEPPVKKRWSSVSARPQDWPNPLLKELEDLKKVHLKTLDELEEVRCDKQDLECERGALKLTIKELERSRKDIELTPARSFSDLNVAECMYNGTSSSNLLKLHQELESAKAQNLQDRVLLDNMTASKMKVEEENESLRRQNEQLQAEIEKMKLVFNSTFESNSNYELRRRHSTTSFNRKQQCIELKEIKELGIKKKKASIYGRVLLVFGKSSDL